MSTVPITCPYCGAYLRVAVQPSEINNAGPQVGKQLQIKFHTQVVSHICKDEDTK